MANKIDTKNLAPPKKATVPPSKRVEEVAEGDDDVLMDQGVDVALMVISYPRRTTTTMRTTTMTMRMRMR